MEEIVLVGLGNPGEKYEGTRHNVGFEVLKKLAQKLNAQWHYDRRCNTYVAKIRALGAVWHLLCPQTFMNLSGQALASYLSFHRIPKERVVVVTDDVNIPFNTLRMRKEGSAGGHNGLKDVERVVGRQYIRLRVGVGSPKESAKENDHPPMALEDYVLRHFTFEEQRMLPSLIERAVECLILLPVNEIETIMSKEKNITKSLKGTGEK